jgi:hypothetical protein
MAIVLLALAGACTLIADVDYRAPRDDRDLTDVGPDSGGAPVFVTPTDAAGAGGAAGSRT